MTFTTPIPFAEAIQKIAGKTVVTSALDSFGWSRMPVALRERAFFSSRVESAVVLQSMQDYFDDFLSAKRMENGGLVAHGRAEFVADMRELAIREGLGRVDPVTGRISPEIRESDLTDIRSISRLQLVFDVQTESSQEFGYFQQGQSPEILDVFPAQRFIRVRPVKAPRPYHLAHEGEIHLKDDLEFWLSMNRDFGVPWGPWGFGSGEGVEDVDREEAIAAGVMKASTKVKPIAKKFNDGLSASIRHLGPDILKALQRATGGTVTGGRLVAPPSTVPAVAPEPAAPTGGFSALLAKLGLDDVKKRLTTEDAGKLIDGLKQAQPVKGTSKIAKLSGASRTKDAVLTREFIHATMDDLVAFLPPGLVNQLPKINIQIQARNGSAAGSYGKSTQTLKLSRAALTDPVSARRTFFHELIHWAHDHGPQSFRDDITAFYAQRTAGEPKVRLMPWNSGAIIGKRDKWLDANDDEYAARIYPWETTPEGLEVVTRHLEKLADPGNLARNWNHVAADGSHAWREAFTECAKLFYL